MRIVMPLFEFYYEGDRFQFSDIYSLERFSLVDVPKDTQNSISKMDKLTLLGANWALVAKNPDVESLIVDINLLLISFRIYAQSSAFIKWRFCKDTPKYSTRLNEEFRQLVSCSQNNIKNENLINVKNGYLRMKEMSEISDRTKNALYFIWRGFSAGKHIDVYIFFVCALEALFSNETSENVTKTFIERSQKYLNGINGFTKTQISKIYKIRSDMVHGRIPHTDKYDKIRKEENIRNIEKVEELIIVCIKKMLGDKTYLVYKDKGEKEEYFSSLLKI